MPRAAESSRAGNTERRRKQRCTRANRPGRGRRTGRHQERPEGDVWSRVFFSPPESPNRRVEEASGTAYAALTPICGHSHTTLQPCNSSKTASVLRPLETDRSPWRYGAASAG